MRRQVLVLGPLPPPFGGVSLHIVRFLELLKSEGITARAHPYTGTSAAGRLRKAQQAARMVGAILLRARPGRGDVLHLHYGGLGYFLALAPLLASTPARLVITFHSVRVLQDLESSPLWKRRLALRLLGRFALFVAVRAEIGEALRGLGLTGPAITVMPAFLPPAPAEQDAGRLPTAVAGALLAAQTAGHVQICCGAYYLGPGYGHQDIYGVEALMAALRRIAPAEGRQLDLWVLVSNRPQSQAQLAAERAVTGAAAVLPGVTLHLHYGLPLLPVMSRCSAFLRPSREDGDSVAVREALSLGMPVLASDVVTRPEGVEIYPGSAEDGLAAALGTFLAALAPTAPGEIRTPLEIQGDRFRRFVAEVIGTDTADGMGPDGGTALRTAGR